MTGRFLHPIANVLTRNGRDCIFNAPLEYHAADGTVYVVPKGATTDGASIPQALWSTGLAPFGAYWLALAGLHDAGYQDTLQVLVNGVPAPAHLTREQTDSLALEAMLSLDVPAEVAQVIFDGVRLGGNWAFAEDRR